MSKDYLLCIVDASTMARANRIANDCMGIYVFEEFSEKLAASKSQFEKGICRNSGFDAFDFVDIDMSISDDDAIQYTMSQDSPDVSHIYTMSKPQGNGNDITDIKLVICARINKNSILLTCDKSLIFHCTKCGIEKLCFKAAASKSISINGEICKSCDFQKLFQEKQDPFFGYGLDKHCENCGGCDFRMPPEAIMLEYGYMDIISPQIP